MPNFSLSRRSVLYAGFAVPLLGACSTMALPRPTGKTVSASAPFDMPSITVPDFGSAKRFLITDFGARQDDQAATSAAIAKAIDAAHTAGQGVVVVPEGTWPTGKVHLKSHVNLHLSKGATLLFSEKPEDYLPPVQTSWEGIECLNYSPLVYAFDCENVAITGEGKLKAKLDVWKLWYARPKPHMDALVALYNMAYKNVPVSERQMVVGENHLRPHFVQLNRCKNVLLEDFSLEDSPFWCIHPLLCRDVVIRRVKVRAHGHNNDGVDPEMSQNVLIEDCVFDQGDDAISVKSGRDMDAWRLNTPTKNVVMRNCKVKNGHQLMAVGSELSGGIENVFVDNCHFVGSGERGDGWAVAINNLLYVKTNERRGGYVKNIHMSNVSATKIAGSVVAVETDVLYQWRTLMPTYVRKLTPIEGLHVSGIKVGEAKNLCFIKGEAELPVRNVSLKNVKVDKVTGTPVRTDNVVGLSV
ncbi:glycoside hydrolase family 28 protein [Asticcacaulis sp. BYS171W]|uniref:Glycoside hydrolase family 28 protein n=1 Tax=Asticcacaulis aquaticus TaxID=2984212 RepID=A0ABT5HPZ5_9CAUL|nr:glycoside hydrolase family 28 protein [Asticcacaulis aquaticus]MDC7682126.1 glycoside hydrolase family 28 protein [Asticcacaulis aquaticus]